MEIDVYFTYADRPYWWTKFLKTGFSHCYLILTTKSGDKIVINPCLRQTQVLYIEQHQALPDYLNKFAIVVKIYTELHYKQTFKPIMPFTCVELVKQVLGINDWRVFTPYQLYRRLTDGQYTKSA